MTNLSDSNLQGEDRQKSKASAAWDGAASSHQGRLFLQREYGVFMIYLFSTAAGTLSAVCAQPGASLLFTVCHRF
ncbi:Yersinia protein of uncharacterised function (DUF3831) [Yersinia enterocolitica]|nr:Yersinia protein of uncharacterised function (DUF3831) [Yersinia enterocolitica]